MSTTRLFAKTYLPELQRVCRDHTTKQHDFEYFASNGPVTFEPGDNLTVLRSLDLRESTCWERLISFLKNVQPWCSIISPQDCRNFVTQTSERAQKGVGQQGHGTRLGLLIISLGCIASDVQHSDDNPSEFPGVDYYHAACQITTPRTSLLDMVRDAQGYILQSFYLLHTLRPVQAYEALRQGSDRIFTLIRMRGRPEATPDVLESIYRAYWACRVFEHHLQQYSPYNTRVTLGAYDDVPLPSPVSNWHHDEFNSSWFTSEVTLSQVAVRPLDNVCWNLSTTQYEPADGLDLSSQLDEWYDSLPPAHSFPLDDTRVGNPVSLQALLSPRKIFFRSQYYALKSALLWPSVVRLGCLLERRTPSRTDAGADPKLRAQSSTDDAQSSEIPGLVGAAESCIHFAVLHILAVEPLFETRHLFLMVDIAALSCMTEILLCTYDAKGLWGALQTHPQAEEVVRISRRCLKTWGESPPVREKIHGIEDLMADKGIGA